MVGMALGDKEMMRSRDSLGHGWIASGLFEQPADRTGRHQVATTADFAAADQPPAVITTLDACRTRPLVFSSSVIKQGSNCQKSTMKKKQAGPQQ